MSPFTNINIYIYIKRPLLIKKKKNQEKIFKLFITYHVDKLDTSQNLFSIRPFQLNSAKFHFFFKMTKIAPLKREKIFSKNPFAPLPPKKIKKKSNVPH